MLRLKNVMLPASSLRLLRSSCVSSHRYFSWEQSFVELNLSFTHSSLLTHLQTLLVDVHEHSNFPWWSEIMCLSIAVRSAMFPVAVYERKLSNKIAKAQIQLNSEKPKIQEKYLKMVAIQKMTSKKMHRQVAHEMAAKRKELILKHNAHPAKKIITFLTPLPFWICISTALGSLCQYSPYSPRNDLTNNALSSMSQEGILWFSDLSQTDPYNILPVAFGTMIWANVKYAQLFRDQNYIQTAPFLKWMFLFIQLYAVFAVFAAAQVPAAMQLYWCTSFTIGLIQNVVLSLPKAKKMLGIEELGPKTKPVNFKLYLKSFFPLTINNK